MMMWDWWDFGWWGVVGVIFILLFWAGLIALIVWGIRTLTRGGSIAAKNTPLDIAKERYAKGEITKEEFEQIKKDLT
jgi:putative membrane protein